MLYTLYLMVKNLKVLLFRNILNNEQVIPYLTKKSREIFKKRKNNLQIKKIPEILYEKIEVKRKAINRSQEKILYFSAKTRAKKKNLPFTITLKDIFIPPYCPILGIPLLCCGPLSDYSPSLDRIIPKYGYIKNNIIVVSLRANRIKSDATIDELKKIYEFYKIILDKSEKMCITG